MYAAHCRSDPDPWALSVDPDPENDADPCNSGSATAKNTPVSPGTCILKVGKAFCLSRWAKSTYWKAGSRRYLSMSGRGAAEGGGGPAVALFFSSGRPSLLVPLPPIRAQKNIFYINSLLQIWRKFHEKNWKKLVRDNKKNLCRLPSMGG